MDGSIGHGGTVGYGGYGGAPAMPHAVPGAYGMPGAAGHYGYPQVRALLLPQRRLAWLMVPMRRQPPSSTLIPPSSRTARPRRRPPTRSTPRNRTAPSRMDTRRRTATPSRPRNTAPTRRRAMRRRARRSSRRAERTAERTARVESILRYMISRHASICLPASFRFAGRSWACVWNAEIRVHSQSTRKGQVALRATDEHHHKHRARA